MRKSRLIDSLRTSLHARIIISPEISHIESEGYGGWTQSGNVHSYEPRYDTKVIDKPEESVPDFKKIHHARMELIRLYRETKFYQCMTRRKILRHLRGSLGYS